MLSLTDFTKDKHYFFHDFQLRAKGIVIEPDTIEFRNLVRIHKGEKEMTLAVRHKHFSLDLKLDYGKGAVWHCDDGLLQMGIPHKKETTIYYSYPNMQTSGAMTLNDKTLPVSGKAWFDRQGGPYNMFKTLTHWEWFSLRFFDDEEMMLFSFPQTGHQDGTYIDKYGQSTRLTDYTLTPREFMMSPEPLRYSSKWELTIPGFKEEHYTILPLSNLQFNLNYYELLAGIHNRNNERVGMCFVELLPGARNKRYSITI